MADFVDFLPSVWNYVMNPIDSGIQALVTSDGTGVGADEFRYIGKDLPVGSAYPNGWVFRDVNDQRPPRNVENTGKASILFSHVDHWSAQVRHHTTKFPILTVFIFADVTRDSNSNPIKQDAEIKVRRVWKEIDRLFHDPGNRVHAFDQLRIISTVEGNPLSIMDVPDADGVVRGTVRYDITL